MIFFLVSDTRESGVPALELVLPKFCEIIRDEENVPERPQIAQSIASAKDHTQAMVEAGFAASRQIAPGDG